MRVICDPPLDQWRPTFGPDRPPVVATGHQAWLWHPGILAKDLALAAAARRFDARPMHLVVDHDAHQALQLALPVKTGDRLSVRTLALAEHDPDVPTGCQPPAPPKHVVGNLTDARDELGDALQVDVGPLIDAFAAMTDCTSLAQQLSAVVARLSSAYTGRIEQTFSSSLNESGAFARLVERMLDNAQHCVTCYNRAAVEHHGAGIAPLIVDRDRVELPLWFLTWGQPRRRVYADLADQRPRLVLSDGTAIEGLDSLAPKALAMTALLRSDHCGLFIHGTGGAAYDRVTEQWWRDWLGGKELAPRATVSADVHLELDAPVAARAELDRAVWWRHYLPHNVDRALQLTGQRVEHKRHLLAHMDDDRDRVRRGRAFTQIHDINADLAAAHGDALEAATLSAARARDGWANHAIAHKRDWCFAFYRPAQLDELARAFG